MEKIYYLSFNGNDTEVMNMLLPYISEEKRIHIEEKSLVIDKLLVAYSNIFVKIALCDAFGIDSQKIAFTKNKYGKPYLIGWPEIFFNLSHTYNALVIGVANRPIGIDIEKVKKANIKIANRYFTEKEILYIVEKKKEIDRRFYEIWTRKEAYIKFVGKGFFIGLKSIDTLKKSNSIQFQTQKRDVYIISLCSTFLDKEIEIVEVLEEDIYNIAKKHLKPYK